MVAMTGTQLGFWRALLAPFEDFELSAVQKGGRELTYIDSRSLMNRLDTVCGPHGWDVEYRPTDRGRICRLGIMVPTAGGTWIWMYKEDGGGFEDMGSRDKRTGEWETDIDNDEKSAYTNAFRRAAQNAWGIGRYLYRKGIPAWLDPDASPKDATRPFLPPPPAPSPAPQPRPEPPAPPGAVNDDGRVEAPAPAPAPPPKPAPAATAPGGYAIPTAGKEVYQWAKRMQDRFETKLLDGMKADASKLGLDPTKFYTWDQESIREIALNAIRYLAGQPTYRGEFDAILAAPPGISPAASHAEISDLKKSVWAKLVGLVEGQVGRKPTTTELSEAFGNVASECQNADGVIGEFPGSLKGLDDEAWLRNIDGFLSDQLRRARASAAGGGDDIPF